MMLLLLTSFPGILEELIKQGTLMQTKNSTKKKSNYVIKILKA